MAKLKSNKHLLNEALTTVEKLRTVIAQREANETTIHTAVTTANDLKSELEQWLQTVEVPKDTPPPFRAQVKYHGNTYIYHSMAGGWIKVGSGLTPMPETAEKLTALWWKKQGVTRGKRKEAAGLEY